MKHLIFSFLVIVCSAVRGQAQDEKAFMYFTNDFELPTNAVFSGAPPPPPSTGFSPSSQVNSPAPAVSFLGLADNFVRLPPDTHGAVGLSNVVTMLNTEVRIQDRSGNVIVTTNLSGFWNGVGVYSNITDPRVLYDPFANRWIASAMVNFGPLINTSNAVLLAVSRDANPALTNWYQYRIGTETNGDLWADQPVTGFNKDWIVMQGNLSRTFASGAPFGTWILIFTKTNLYAGMAASFRSNVITGIGYSQTPAVTLDPTATNLFLVQNVRGSNQIVSAGQTNRAGLMRLYEIFGSIGSETIRSFDHFATNQPWADAPPVFNFAPQLGFATNIYNNDSRVRSVITRSNSIWCAHSIFLPVTNTSRTAVQWWQFSSDGTVRQSGRIDDSAGKRFFGFPSIAINRFGDALIGYSSFATNQYASASYSYRNFHDEVGTLQMERVYKAGEGIYHRQVQRWGDYSATVVDPVNDTDFWTIQEYAATPVEPATANTNGRWGTWWAKVEVSKPANDYFTNRITLSGAAGSTNGTTIRATRETGETNHAGNTNGASLWYQWTPPSAGNVFLDTVGSAAKTALAVYTGTAIGSLTLVTNHAGALSGASRVIFNAAATNYHIAVDGWNGSMANTLLQWQRPTTPVFVTEPTNQTKYVETSVTFTAQAVGNPGVSYQWRFEGANISGATNASYTRSNLVTNDTGGYSVIVSNSVGSVTSATAQLTVLNHAATFADALWTNQTFQFTVAREVSFNYIVQVSTNLSTTNWVSLSTNAAPFTYTVTDATNSPQRYYRALYKP